MEPKGIEQMNSLIPPSVVNSVTAPALLPDNPLPAVQQNTPIPKTLTRIWVTIALSLVTLSLIGLNIYTYQQLKKSKSDLRASSEENRNLVTENAVYRAALLDTGAGTDKSTVAAKEEADNAVIENNARSINSALNQYYIDNADNYPVSSKRTGAVIEELAGALASYIDSSTVYLHTLQALYITTSDGKYYVQIHCLYGDGDSPVTQRNGVYVVRDGSVTFPTEPLLLRQGVWEDKVITGLTCKQAYLSYGPQ